MPNCTAEIEAQRLEFGRLGRHVIEGRFDGGNMTSDAGIMLLAKLDQRLGLTEAASRAIADPREPSKVTHSIRDMLHQRVYGLVQGWEDLNSHAQLRCDIAYQVAVGREDEPASAPTLCRLEKLGDRASAVKLHEVLVDQFIASFKRLRAIVLKGTVLANAQISTLRDRLLKLAAVITRNTRRIRLHLASQWPSAPIFQSALHALNSG